MLGWLALAQAYKVAYRLWRTDSLASSGLTRYDTVVPVVPPSPVASSHPGPGDDPYPLPTWSPFPSRACENR